MIITEKDKELFFKNGYLVIKNFLNKNEVDEFREYVSQEYLKKIKKKEKKDRNNITNIVNFLAVNYRFIKLFNNKKIKKILNILYPEQKYISSLLNKCFHSEYINTQNNLSNFHIDNYRFTTDNDVYKQNLSEKFSILKSMIYFQDLDIYSDTLKVLPGSHKYKFIFDDKLKIKNVNKFLKKKKVKLSDKIIVEIDKNVKHLDINSGDLILFDIRLLHSGHSSRIKGFKNIVLTDEYERKKNEFKEFIEKKNNIPRILIQNDYLIHNNIYLDHVDEFYKRYHMLYRKWFKTIALNHEEVKNLEKKTGIESTKYLYKYTKNKISK